MEENQNENDDNSLMDMSPGINLFRPTRRERIKQKAKDVIKIIMSVIGHQFKLTVLIASIALIVIILLCSTAMYIIEGNNLDQLFEMFSM